MLLNHELKNKSGKVKTTLKTVLLNFYSVHLSDPSLFIKYSRDENFYGKRLRRYVGNSIAYSSFITKIIPGLLRLRLIEDHKGFNERSAFLEFNGEYSREDAERMAQRELNQCVLTIGKQD